MNTAPEKRWLSVAETAAYLSTSKKHLYSLASRRILPSSKLRGVGIRFDKKALDRLLEATIEVRSS